MPRRNYKRCRDPEAAETGSRQPRNNRFGVFLNEIDEHLKRGLTGPDQERDRTIFWLYFRQGMSTKEIASLAAVGLSAKGVGSVIDRMKHCLRQQVLGLGFNSGNTKDEDKSKFHREIVIDLCGSSEYETSGR